MSTKTSSPTETAVPQNISTSLPSTVHPLRLVIFGLLLGIALSGLLLWMLWRPVPAAMTLQTPVIEQPPVQLSTPPANRNASVQIVTTLVNINSATLAELETLPGIGPAKAQAIVDGRPYSMVDDLDRVSGFGAATIDALRSFVIVE